MVDNPPLWLVVKRDGGLTSCTVGIGVVELEDHFFDKVGDVFIVDAAHRDGPAVCMLRRHLRTLVVREWDCNVPVDNRPVQRDSLNLVASWHDPPERASPLSWNLSITIPKLVAHPFDIEFGQPA